MSRRSNSQTYLRNRTPNGRFESARAVILRQQEFFREREFQEELQRERDLIAQLAELSPAKLDWYADDANVPPYGPAADRIAVLERLIREATQENQPAAPCAVIA